MDGLLPNKLGNSRITPSHDVVLPFTRMVSGPVDYTPVASDIYRSCVFIYRQLKFLTLVRNDR
jgi:hypothetical protein